LLFAFYNNFIGNSEFIIFFANFIYDVCYVLYGRLFVMFLMGYYSL
jgi:hypothetical protein